MIKLSNSFHPPHKPDDLVLHGYRSLGQIKNNIIFRSGDLFHTEYFYLMANVKQQEL